jgi:hypothetical protein
MDAWPNQIWQEIVARPDGPLALRFYMQPTMAAFLALRDGLKDSIDGKPPYLWAVFKDVDQRRELVRNGWTSVGKVFILAAILDVIYQFIVFDAIRPLQTLFVATVLAIVPYILLRGPINRIITVVRSSVRARPL